MFNGCNEAERLHNGFRHTTTKFRNGVEDRFLSLPVDIIHHILFYTGVVKYYYYAPI